ncbi:MAG: fasciclin domain-containing protein [Chitinophagales bacterium]
MKKIISHYCIAAVLLLLTSSCGETEKTGGTTVSDAAADKKSGQSAVQDDVSQKDVVKVAVGSADHTTLVAAIQAADLVDALSNAGPFTVFAPTNDAFAKLPAGTVDNLLKPENKSALQDVLYHHVTTSALDVSFFSDGQTLSMVDGKSVTMHVKGSDVYVDEAKIIGSVRASNGWVHVVDGVVLAK